MDTSRISFGEMIAGAGGLVLLISLFLSWYGIEVEGVPGIEGANLNAWESFGFIDLLLFLAAAAAIAQAVIRAMGVDLNLPAPLAQIIAIVGAAALLLVIFRLLVTPEADALFGAGIDLTRKFGIFVGLIGAAAIAFGGFTAMRERAGGEAPPAAA